MSWGTPPNPRQGAPCTPTLGRDRIGGHPQTPGREDPAPPGWGIRGRIGGHPPNPRQGGPCTPFGDEGMSWGTPPSPRRGGPCTPWERIGGTAPNPRQGEPCSPIFMVGEE